MRSSTRRTTISLLASLLLVSTAVFATAPALGDGDDKSTTTDTTMWFEDRVVFGFKSGIPDDAVQWITDLDGRILLVNEAIDFVLAEFDSNQAADGAMGKAWERPDLRYVEYDARIHLDEPVEIVVLADPSATWDGGYTPNNPLWPDQWGPVAISAPGAWDLTRGNHSVKLGIADTGITGHHENLQGNICGPHISGSVDALATSGHGTHVAGIAAAAIDTGIGIAGLSQSCLMSIRVLGGGSAALAAGITFAADNDVDAINMSFWASQNNAFRDALEYAYFERDVVLIKSAGNQGCPGGTTANANAYASAHSMTWPGPERSVIATAALAPPGSGPASFSSCGNQMELAAPGQSIIAPYGNGYASLSGTSMAAPHVTGTVGLIRAANPDLTALEVRCVLAQSADDIGLPGWDPYTGWGRINAERAVQMALDYDDAGSNRQSDTMPTCVLPIPLLA